LSEEVKAENSNEAAVEAPATKTASKTSKSGKGNFFWGVGRRKTSVARVRVRPGAGGFKVNGKDIKEYFCIERLRTEATSPLTATNMAGKVDVFVNVQGGGTTGQSGATLLGVARALLKMDEGLEATLRSNGFMTRDARKVERKKYGRAGARKSFQFSKR